MGNVKLTMSSVAILTATDLGYHTVITPNYVFRASEFQDFDYLVFLLVVFLRNFAKRRLFQAVLWLILLLTAA